MRPDEPARTGVLARRNPVAKLAAGFALTVALLASIDPITPAITLAVELAVVPAFGVGFATLLRRAGPILLGALGLVLTLVIFAGVRGGAVLASLGPFVITTGLLSNALALCLRLIAVSLPGILVFATTDPTDLADSLIQNARAPARFAIGALAAFRLMPLLSQEWRTLALARRARGIDAGGNPVAYARLFASTTFGLLVGAIRRGARLATAMDARGFDSHVRRSIARPQHFGPADAAFVAAALLVAAIAVAASIALGAFTPVLA
jgi:energy-coupling factor transport system permease protein